MKKIFLVFNFFVLLFTSCETEFDVNADGDEIIVVYGLLDSSKDTQFVKINKAFLGEDDAPNSKTLVANSVNVGVGQGVNVAKATQITIIGNDTGATTSITITNNVTLASLALSS